MFFALLILLSAQAAPATEPVAEPQRGGFQVRFAQPSPLSAIEVQSKRHHIKVADTHRYDLASETFELFVPEDYDPDRPWGLLVFVSPHDSGAILRTYRPVMSEHQIIWVGANNSGNERGVGARMGLALDAVHNLRQIYNIDDSRVYVSGVSGGGKVATMLAVIYPEVFDGALAIVGTTYFRHIPLPNETNKFWPGMFEKPPAATLERAKRDSRFVLLTGSEDFNRDPIRGAYDQFVADGFAHVEYVEVPGMKHEPPEATWFARAIEAMDRPLAALAKDQFQQAQEQEGAGRLADALHLYSQVAAHGDAAISSRAEDKLANLLQRRDEQMILAHRAAEEERFVEAARIALRLIEQFGPRAPAEARELIERLKSDPAAAAQIQAAAEQAERAQREANATAALEAARKLVPRDARRGAEALRAVSKNFPNTQAAMQAHAELENLLADPNTRRQLESAPGEDDAQRLLLMAENYERNGLRNEAIERLETIVRDHPKTTAATKAKRKLEQLRR